MIYIHVLLDAYLTLFPYREALLGRKCSCPGSRADVEFQPVIYVVHAVLNSLISTSI